MSAFEAYHKAIELGIKVPFDISDSEIERVYNGVGPEWMAGWLRKCLDFLFGDKFAKVCDIFGLPAYIAAVEDTDNTNKEGKL